MHIHIILDLWLMIIDRLFNNISDSLQLHWECLSYKTEEEEEEKKRKICLFDVY